MHREIADLLDPAFLDLEQVREIATEQQLDRAEGRLLREVVHDDVFAHPRVDDGQPVKLTLTLPLRQASWLVERARASGVSYGAYLASMIDGEPFPGGLADAVGALMASTDQLASVSTDFTAFLGLIQQGRSAEAERYREAVVWYFGEVRKHMKLTAALAAEVRRAVRLRPTKANPS